MSLQRRVSGGDASCAGDVGRSCAVSARWCGRQPFGLRMGRELLVLWKMEEWITSVAVIVDDRARSTTRRIRGTTLAGELFGDGLIPPAAVGVYCGYFKAFK